VIHPVLTVFAKEFRENLRDRRTLFSALVFGPLFVPLMFAAALALMVEHGSSEEESLWTLAVAHSERAPNLMQYLRQNGVKIERVSYDDAQARAAVSERKHKLVLFVPAEFAELIGKSEPAPLLLYADSSDNLNERNANRIRGLIGQYNLTLVRLKLMARGVDPLLLTAIVPQDIDVATPASRSVLVLGTLSYLVLITMLMGGLYLAIDATAGERERGSLESLLTLPVRREALIYGKILAACAFMLLSLSLTVIALAIVLRFVGLERFGMSINLGPLMALKIIAYSVPLVPLGAALMTIVAAFTRSYREAQTYVGMVLLVPTLPLVFAGALGLRPTAWMMAVPSLSQHFLIMSLLRAETVPGAHLLISIGVSLLLGLALAALAGRLYHREALLG
jgi:sodium transport system permease protein